jgi:5-methylcytosine-specific restriction protein A
MHPCEYPGCGALIASGKYCNSHRLPRRPQQKNARQSGYSGRWDAYAKGYLRKHPFCCDPFHRHAGVLIEATVCGHRVPHRGDTHLLWNPDNHYPLCGPCNSFQCAKFEGGFGNPKRDGALVQNYVASQVGNLRNTRRQSGTN